MIRSTITFGENSILIFPYKTDEYGKCCLVMKEIPWRFFRPAGGYSEEELKEIDRESRHTIAIEFRDGEGLKTVREAIELLEEWHERDNKNKNQQELFKDE